MPLSPADRKVLAQRRQLLARIMQWLYWGLALGIVLFTAKDFLVYGEFQSASFRDYLAFGALASGSLAICHAFITWSERRVRSALRADLSAGIKLRRLGTLLGVEARGENEPVRLQFCELTSTEFEEFALFTIGDLLRIKPNALVGKRVEIEYAPNSRIVLQLRESL